MARKEQRPEKKTRPNPHAKADAAPVAASAAPIRSSKTKVSGNTVIMRCTCPHEYQDGRYGAGMRVFDVGVTATGRTGHCTVCGTAKGC